MSEPEQSRTKQLSNALKEQAIEVSKLNTVLLQLRVEFSDLDETEPFKVLEETIKKSHNLLLSLP